MTDESPRSTGRLRISQETIAIVTVGVALAGLILITTGDLRNEAREDRSEWEAQSRQLRDEARSDREAFQREILRLTQGQTERAAIVAATPPKNE